MKVIVTLAVLLFVTAEISAREDRLSEECLNGIADRNKCCDGVPDAWYAHLRNPEDCESFYQCEHNEATWKPCPAGLEWSVAADKCDWPESAQCKTGNGNEGENTSTSAPSTTTAPPAPTTTAPPAPTTTAPPAPTTTATPSPTPEDQCEPEPVCHQCIIGTFPAELCCKGVKNYHKLNLANSEDCSSYYTCANDHAFLRQCPEGLHWSIETDRCEWPQVAKCEANNGGENGNDGSSSEEGNNGGDGSSSEEGNNGGDGSSSEEGNNGGGGGSGETGNGGVSQDCLEGKIDAETCCKHVPDWIDVLLQNNADCHTYFQCVYGRPMVRPCPANLWWSITANRCEWQHLATCTWESQPSK